MPEIAGPEVGRPTTIDEVTPEWLTAVLRTSGEKRIGGRDWLAALASEVAPPGKSLEAPSANVDPSRNLMTIYTSGTTGLPKGILNNHLKFFLIGKAVSGKPLSADDLVGSIPKMFYTGI